MTSRSVLIEKFSLEHYFKLLEHHHSRVFVMLITFILAFCIRIQKTFLLSLFIYITQLDV